MRVGAPVFVPSSPPSYQSNNGNNLQSFEQFIKLQDVKWNYYNQTTNNQYEPLNNLGGGFSTTNGQLSAMRLSAAEKKSSVALTFAEQKFRSKYAERRSSKAGQRKQMDPERKMELDRHCQEVERRFVAKHHNRQPCAFCVRQGADKSMCESHCLRNPVTNAIMCPELKRHQVCDQCGDTGADYVHAGFEHQAYVDDPLSLLPILREH